MSTAIKPAPKVIPYAGPRVARVRPPLPGMTAEQRARLARLDDDYRRREQLVPTEGLTAESLKRSTAEERKEEYRDQILMAAKRIIKDSIGNPDFTLEELADRLNMCSRNLQRIFRRRGTSFRKVITAERMKQAERLLKAPHIPVHEIAERVGYRHPMHFSKAFRRHTGLGPREWRNHNASLGDRLRRIPVAA